MNLTIFHFPLSSMGSLISRRRMSIESRSHTFSIIFIRVNSYTSGYYYFYNFFYHYYYYYYCYYCYYYYYYYYYYRIDRRIYLNLIKSKRRMADSVEDCCQTALLNVQIITLSYYFHFLYRSLSPCQKSACWIFSCFRSPS